MSNTKQGSTPSSAPGSTSMARHDPSTGDGVEGLRRLLPAARWRSIDLMATATIGIVFGVAYWGWSSAYTALSSPVSGFLGSSIGLLGGPWLIAGVVGGFVVRKPGAALFAELLAAAVEALLGNEWGWATLISGTLQGLGVEVALGIFLFRRFGWPVAMLGGAL